MSIKQITIICFAIAVCVYGIWATFKRNNTTLKWIPVKWDDLKDEDTVRIEFWKIDKTQFFKKYFAREFKGKIYLLEDGALYDWDERIPLQPSDFINYKIEVLN